jgi:outer membrane protein assembly factor BamB
MKLLTLTLLLFLTSHAAAATWTAWRGGAEGAGRTTVKNLPTSWSKEQNVRWRVDLPEAGNSTPVVFGEKIFVTQPETATHWRGLYCFDLNTGKQLWKQGLRYDQEERTHRTNPYCSASPTTDGQVVIAAYGSAGVAAYDLDGKQLWHRDLGKIDHTWGNSTSPVLHGDLCLHYHGPGKGAFLIALNKSTGETVWQWNEPDWQPGERTDGFKGQGEGVIGSFSTPILIDHAGRKELIMSFPMEMKAFDPATGALLWTAAGLNPLVYTSPAFADGIVLAFGGYRGNSIGVKVGGQGDVTSSHRLWQEEQHNGGIGTGVIKDGHYYYHDSGGIVCCLAIQTGKTLWKERLPGAGKSWGSFVLAGDLIYTLSQTGDTVVFRPNTEKLDVVAQADVGEQTNSSLVPINGGFLIRTHKGLWCIGADKS